MGTAQSNPQQEASTSSNGGGGITSCWSGRATRQIIDENKMEPPPSSSSRRYNNSNNNGNNEHMTNGQVTASSTSSTSTSITSLYHKGAAPLPEPIDHHSIVTARSLAVPLSTSTTSTGNDNDNDILVSPLAYPISLSLRLRRQPNGGNDVRVHIMIHDTRSYSYVSHTRVSTMATATVTATAIATVTVTAPSATVGVGVTANPQVSTESKYESLTVAGAEQAISSVDMVGDAANLAIELQSEKRRAAEDSAAILLSYVTQQWPNQKTFDGWVYTSFQPLPAPNQSDTKFRVECVLPASPNVVIDAMRTWCTGSNRLKWDTAMQSYHDIDIVDDHTRVVAACTKAVSAGFAQVESREFIDLSLCRMLTRNERQTIIDSLPPTHDAIPLGEWWLSTVRADVSSSSREVSPSCVRATNHPNGVVIYPAANGASRIILIVYSELQLGWKKSFLRSTMPSELKTMMTRLRNYLQATTTSTSTPTSRTASDKSLSVSLPLPSPSQPNVSSSPVAISSDGATATPISSANTIIVAASA